jgi:phosphate transport system substrate-binding protein
LKNGEFFPILFVGLNAYQTFANAHCGAQVSYNAVGSGAGINDLLNQTVDFGATDAPLSDAQETSSTNGLIIHIPVTLGAVAIGYNLGSTLNGTHLQLTGPVIADIFLGKVKFWDDPEITGLNAGTTLPHQSITVEHRSDGSGTTSIFTHYLSAISPTWANGPGAGTTINWPTGVGGPKNAGVAANVKNTLGSIGYIELSYIVANPSAFGYASVQNSSGSYVLPSIDGAAQDASNVPTIPADLRFYIVNAPGASSYPISGFSWVVVYQHQSNADKGKAIANMLWWMVHTGQQYSASQTYATLPSNIVTKDEGQIQSMTCGSSNTPCYSAS